MNPEHQDADESTSSQDLPKESQCLGTATDTWTAPSTLQRILTGQSFWDIVGPALLTASGGERQGGGWTEGTHATSLECNGEDSTGALNLPQLPCTPSTRPSSTVLPSEPVDDLRLMTTLGPSASRSPRFYLFLWSFSWTLTCLVVNIFSWLFFFRPFTGIRSPAFLFPLTSHWLLSLY
eukprot:XP_017173513.1 PREDICTED: uncharacterized protein A830021F12Rik [Mus musculus]